MPIASVILTPTVVRSDSGRIGVAILDNPNVLDNTHKSVWIIYADNTWRQATRAGMNVVNEAPTGMAAFSFLAGLGPGA